jgi:hypothetical protein
MVKTCSSPLRTRTNDVDSLATIVKLKKLIMRLKLTFSRDKEFLSWLKFLSCISLSHISLSPAPLNSHALLTP